MGKTKFKVDWRMEGTPEETRYESVVDAERARRRVHRMVPKGPKGKKQTGGRRPNPITAERVHHSRGRKWEEFLKATGYDRLSEHEQLLLMDSFKNGGREVFANWKQREYERWLVIDRVTVLDFATGKKIAVQLSDGSVIYQDYVDPKDEQRKKKVRKAKIKPAHCDSCGVKLPNVFRKRGQCVACRPALSAQKFFESLNKKKMAV